MAARKPALRSCTPYGCMKLLAETEGIFTETAGGVTVGVARKLIEQGRIPRDESLVISITGNGLKTQEALAGKLTERPVIEARMAAFDELLSTIEDNPA